MNTQTIDNDQIILKEFINKSKTMKIYKKLLDPQSARQLYRWQLFYASFEAAQKSITDLTTTPKSKRFIQSK